MIDEQYNEHIRLKNRAQTKKMVKECAKLEECIALTMDVLAVNVPNYTS